MASMKYIAPNGKVKMTSLGNDIEKAKKRYNEEVERLKEYHKCWHKKNLIIRQYGDDKIGVIFKWFEENEWFEEELIFDETNNSIYE